MDLDWVQTFLAAAKTENFRQAAKLRYISQAAISQHIAHLEAALGTPLFDRVGRRVRLSSAGQAFLPYARRLVETAEAGRAQVWAIEAGRKRPLRLAATPLLAESSLLSWLCRQLLLHEPSIDLIVRVESTKVIGHALATGEIDGALTDESVNGLGGTVCLLFRDPVELLTGLEGDHDTPAPDTAFMLQRQRLILVSSAPYVAPFMSELERHRRIVATMTVDHPAVAKRLAEEGAGLTILPRLSVTRELMEGRLFALSTASLPTLAPLSVFWIAADAPSDTVTLVDTILKQRWGGVS